MGIFSLANHKPCEIEKDGIYNWKIYIQATGGALRCNLEWVNHLPISKALEGVGQKLRITCGRGRLLIFNFD